MRAIVAARPGGPDVLEPNAVAEPEVGPGQLLIKVAAAGINFADIYRRAGTYPAQFPFVPGQEAAGTISKIGAGVQGLSVGERVATAESTRCYADYAVIDQEKALPVPDAVDDLMAAALPLQGMTAHFLVNSAYRVEPGQTVLVHAGAGGVGQLVIQLLNARGARVITTVSSEEKAMLANQAGADAALPHQGFAHEVRELTDGEGVDVVLDGVGKDTFDGSLASLRIRGCLVLFGAASGPVPPFDLSRLSSGSLIITRPTSRDYLQNAQERRWRAAEIFDAAAQGSLKIRIGQTYSLEEAASAHRDLEARRTTGKVLLIP